jgi:hypothetical protein
MSNDIIKYHSNYSSRGSVTDQNILTDAEKELLFTAHNKEWTQPRFKVRWFIGEASFTPFGKLRQYMTELKSREYSIESLEYEIAKFEVQEKMFLRDAETTDDELQKEMLLIEAGKVRKDIGRSVNRCADVYKERRDYLDLIQELLDSPDGKTADGRSLMSIIGTPEEEEFEKQYWTVRMASQAAMDMSAYGRIGAGNLEAIQMLSPEQQVEVVGLANHMNLRFERRQDLIRNEVAKNLGLLPAKQAGYIGEVTSDFINKVLEVDKKGMEEELRARQMQVQPDEQQLIENNSGEKDDGLNQVYNV